MRLLFVILLILASWFLGCAGQDPTPPTFPEDFRMYLEYTDAARWETWLQMELHDYTNNRLRLDEMRNGSSIIRIYEIDEGLLYEMDMSTFSCVTSWINETDTTGMIENGHLVNSSVFLYFSQDFGYTYSGTDEVRDVLCNRWTSSYSFTYTDGTLENGTIDYYFSHPNWTFHGGIEMAGSGGFISPMRARVTGLRFPSLEIVDMNYEFSYFSAQGANQWDFQLPYWFGCEHAVHVPFPQNLTDGWETAVEYTNIIAGETTSLYIYADVGLRRVEQYLSNGSSVITLMDEWIDRSFEVVDRECTQSVFTGQVESSADMFRWGPGYLDSYRYVGVHNVRGIPCDHWRADFEEEYANLTFDWSFARSDWKLQGNGEVFTQIPVSLVVTGAEKDDGSPVHEEYHLINYTPEPPSERVWHISDRYLCGWIAPPAADPLPTFPSEFELSGRSSGAVWSEDTDYAYNFTAYWHMWYDAPHNRTRVYYRDVDDEFNDVFLLDQNLYIHVANDNCTVFDLSLHVDEPLPSTFIEHNHLRDPTDLFDFGAQYPEQFQGTRWVGDIKCDLWSSSRNTSFTDEDGTLIIESRLVLFYFAYDDWHIPENNPPQRVPVQVTNRGELTWPNGTKLYYETTLEFASFRVGDVGTDAWVPPRHVYCYSDAPQRMPTLSPVYEAAMQLVSTSDKRAMDLMEYVDADASNFRFDFTSQSEHSIALWRFEEDSYIEYKVTRDPEDETKLTSTCKVEKASTTDFGQSGQYQNISAFMAISDTEEDFQGERIVRGITCRLWTRPFFNVTQGSVVSNFILEHYFSSPDFEMPNALFVPKSEAAEVPVRLAIHGHTYDTATGEFKLFDLTYDFTHFIKRVLDPSTFVVQQNWNCAGYAYDQPSNVGDNSDAEIDIVRWTLLQGFFIVVFCACFVLGALFGGFTVFLSSSRSLMLRARRFAEARIQQIQDKRAHSANIREIDMEPDSSINDRMDNGDNEDDL